jgi:hypothetical protein
MEKRKYAGDWNENGLPNEQIFSFECSSTDPNADRRRVARFGCVTFQWKGRAKCSNDIHTDAYS